MLKPTLVAAALAIGLTSYASAQSAPAPLAPAGVAAPAPGADRPPAPGDVPPPPPGPGMGPRPGDHRGPPPPPPIGKGVEIRMGRDAGIRIECGDEPMQACLAAAKPLTDKIPQLTMPPAPPAPLAPPAPGEMPTPPAN